MSERTRINIVPATLDIVQPFFGGLPPHRLRAYAGKLGDTTVGVGGLYYLSDDTRVGFLILTEEGRKFPRAVVRATRQFLSLLIKEGVPSIRAVADPEIDAAPRFLLHFGFKPLEVFQGQVIYQWLAPAPQ